MNIDFKVIGMKYERPVEIRNNFLTLDEPSGLINYLADFRAEVPENSSIIFDHETVEDYLIKWKEEDLYSDVTIHKKDVTSVSMQLTKYNQWAVYINSNSDTINIFFNYKDFGIAQEAKNKICNYVYS